MNTRIIGATGIAVRIAIVSILLLCVVLNVACKSKDRVIYEVTGDADVADVVISDEDGVMEQYYDVSLPWRREYGVFEQDYVYLYAYNRTESGTISIAIYVNDRVFKSATASGPYQSIVVVGTK